MPLSPDIRVQSNTGTLSGAGPVTVTLPNLTAPGSTILVAMMATGVTIPDGWARDQVNSSQLQLFRRAQPDGGEQSWAFSGPAAVWSWYAEEIAGADLVDPVDSSAAGTGGTGISAVPSGTTGTTVSADTMALAVFGGIRGGAGNGIFPAAHSYDSGFTELAYVTNGTGNGAGDNLVTATELYPGATGTFGTTMTWDTTGGGTLTNLTSYGVIVAYRAAGTLPGGGVLAAAVPP